MTPQNGVAVQARIEIALLSNGQLMCHKQVPNRFLFNAMMETARQQMIAEFVEQEQQKVVAPSEKAVELLKL